MDTVKHVARLAVVAVMGAATLAATATNAWAYHTSGCRFISADVTVFHYDTGSYYTDTKQAEADWTNTVSPVEFSNQSTVKNVYMTTDAINFGNTGSDGYTNYASPACSSGKYKLASVASKYNTYYTDGYSTNGRVQVMVHELGHALGLQHAGTSACSGQPIMYSSSDRYFTCGHVSPQPDDVNGVNAIY